MGLVGEVAVFEASALLSLETDDLRRGSWTSLPVWNMKRRSCHVGEEVVVVVRDDRLVRGGWLELFSEVTVIVVGEVGISGASAPLLLERDILRLGSRTSLPTWNMKRRSCQVGEDMMGGA